MAVFVFHSIAHRRCNVHNPLYLRFPFTVRMCSIRPSHPNRQFPMASANIRAFAKSLRFIMRESHDQVSQQSKQDDKFFSYVSYMVTVYPCCVNCFPVSPFIVLNNVISPVSFISMAVGSLQFSWYYPLFHSYTCCFLLTHSAIIPC